MIRLLALLALVSLPAFGWGTAGGGLTPCPKGYTGGGLTPCAPARAFFEFAPADGAGMGTACACTAVTGAKGEPTTTTRSSVAECPSNDAQRLTQCAANQPRVSSGAVNSSVLGVWQEPTRTNLAIQCRDFSQPAWTKSNVTCARTATGMRNDANGASTCTASAINGTVLQAITQTIALHATSFRVKRRTGTGAISVTNDGGATWTALGPPINPIGLSSSEWRWVVPTESAGCTSTTAPGFSKCIVVPALSVVSANPSIGFKFAASGDAIDIDFAQLELAPEDGASSTPIETVAVSAQRVVDIVDPAMSPTLPAGFCVAATSLVAPLSSAGLKRLHGVPGSGTPGVVTGSASEVASYYQFSLVVDGTPSNPTTFNTAIASTSQVIRATSYIGGTGTTMNGCLNGLCGAGTSVTTWTPPTWTRLRLGTYDSTNGSINGVIKEVQLDPLTSRCSRGLSVGAIPLSVATIGDSITCCPTGPGTGWPESLQVLMPTRGIGNLAISGATTTAVATQWQDRARGHGFATITVLAGINDIRTSVATATIEANLQSIYDGAISMSMKLIPITVMPASNVAGWTGAMQTAVTDVNAWILAYCSSHGLTCVDAYNSSLRSGTALNATYDSGDGLHPNQAGSDYLATLVQAANP